MKYMILVYSDPTLEPAFGTPEFEVMMRGYGAVNQTMEAAGVMIHGDGLQDVETATSLRTRGGQTQTMDGPFADTKERLGGYYVLECQDLDEALKYAAMIPSAAYGTIEVRPVADYGL